ncbi:MAG TPA: hypothetical protein VKU01_01255 [Bryobacteraceae bacterium]|nr:hypothetical protein [Bryobacteraceae bacterium]
MRLRAWTCAAVLAVALWGCGQVGEPVYPSLNIPVKITDLSAVQRGDNLIIDFSVPKLTTDGMAVKHVRVDLRAGSKEIPILETEPGPIHTEPPVNELVGQIGQQIAVQVRLVNAKGKESEWSNQVVLNIQAPLATPSGLAAADTAQGTKLTWSAPGENHFRIFRDKAQIGESDAPEYVDKNIEYGKQYDYAVQGTKEGAESKVSETVPHSAKDTFAPAVPAGVNASPGINTIEVAWDRNTESDFKEYRVYRAVDDGQFVQVATGLAAPAYSDKDIQSGKRYRYAVSAIDQANNESERSAPAEVTAP